MTSFAARGDRAVLYVILLPKMALRRPPAPGEGVPDRKGPDLKVWRRIEAKRQNAKRQNDWGPGL